MLELQTYIKKHFKRIKKTEKWGGCCSSWGEGGLYPPRGGDKNMTGGRDDLIYVS